MTTNTRGTSAIDPTGSVTGAGATEGGARIEGGSQYTDSEGPGPRLMSASTLEGDKVVVTWEDNKGEKRTDETTIN